jgi:hypothetical protein
VAKDRQIAALPLSEENPACSFASSSWIQSTGDNARVPRLFHLGPSFHWSRARCLQENVNAAPPSQSPCAAIAFDWTAPQRVPKRCSNWASDRQISANRGNALKSTGPRTDTGKANSAQNALTHGLTAQSALLRNENPKDYDNCRQFKALSPGSDVESRIVERIVNILWRLRRIPEFEVFLLDTHGLREAIRNDSLGKLTRYESAQSRQAELAFAELDRQQRIQRDWLAQVLGPEDPHLEP